jgi:hypothetical protein
MTGRKFRMLLRGALGILFLVGIPFLGKSVRGREGGER